MYKSRRINFDRVINHGTNEEITIITIITRGELAIVPHCYTFSLSSRRQKNVSYSAFCNVRVRKGGTEARTAFQRRCPREFFECPCVMDHHGLIVASGANRGGPFASERRLTCRGSRKREHVPPPGWVRGG